MKRVSVLPTLLTLGNTFCGFLAIAKVGDALAIGPDNPEAFRDNMIFASFLIFIAMVFDALDGRVARMTRGSSDFGAQLDSLTDLVTFGVAPAFMVKALAEVSFQASGTEFHTRLLLMLCVIYVIFAALRLARFTLETSSEADDHDRFRGLPTPAGAAVVASAIIFYFEVVHTQSRAPQGTAISFVWFIVICVPTLGLLMVSPVEYTHLVNRYLRGRKPFQYLVQVVTIVLLLIFFHEWVIFVFGVLYVAAGPLLYAFRRRKRSDDKDADSQWPQAGGTPSENPVPSEI